MDNSDKLLTALTDLSTSQNTIHFTEFERFIPLYQRANEMSDAELSELSESFRRSIDPYENLNIVDSNGKVLLTLPRPASATRSIDKEFEREKTVFRGQCNDEIPRSRSEAIMGLANSFKASARNPEFVEEVRARVADYHTLNEEFLSRKNTEVPTEQIEETTEEAFVPSESSEFDWVIG